MSYGFAGNLRDALPNASFIGFNGKSFMKTYATNQAVFSDYFRIYDIRNRLLRLSADSPVLLAIIKQDGKV